MDLCSVQLLFDVILPQIIYISTIHFLWLTLLMLEGAFQQKLHSLCHHHHKHYHPLNNDKRKKKKWDEKMEKLGSENNKTFKWNFFAINFLFYFVIFANAVPLSPVGSVSGSWTKKRKRKYIHHQFIKWKKRSRVNSAKEHKIRRDKKTENNK